MSDNPFDREEEDLVGQQINRISSLRRDCAKLWEWLDKLTPGRYGSLAKTALEQVFLWAEKGIEQSDK